MRDLAALPKGHLHIHLEGAMRPATLAELAEREGITVPPIRGFGSFTAFIDTYHAACQVLRSPQDLARVTREVIADAADHGAVWVEPAWYPSHAYDHLGDQRTTTEIVLEAGAAEAAARGIGFGLMLSADRLQSVEEAIELARLAALLTDAGVVSFGLANDEAISPPAPYAEAFRIAHEAGLLCTPHAGELAGAQSVWDALDHLFADRILHGVRSVEDPELLTRLADSGICLDVCPSSNVLLSVVPSLAEHPLPTLLEAGIRCSLNSDDPLLFGPNLLEEYQLCRRELGFDDATLASIATSSLECSGAPKDVAAAGVSRIREWLSTPS